MSIIEEIRRFLLPEIIRLEEKNKSLDSRNEELLRIVSKLQGEILHLKDRVLKLEIKYEGIEEKIVAKIILTLLKHSKQLPGESEKNK